MYIKPCLTLYKQFVGPGLGVCDIAIVKVERFTLHQYV